VAGSKHAPAGGSWGPAAGALLTVSICTWMAFTSTAAKNLTLDLVSIVSPALRPYQRLTLAVLRCLW
jgi:hypothetical protein